MAQRRNSIGRSAIVFMAGLLTSAKETEGEENRKCRRQIHHDYNGRRSWSLDGVSARSSAKPPLRLWIFVWRETN
jgi:hypothetical protein